jgi:hypothetical protein
MDYRNMTIPAFPPQSRKELALSRTIPNDRKPVWVYIVDRLGPGSIKTMLRALDTIARIASGGTDGVVTFRWPELRYKHTSAIRSTLAARYKPAMANKMLSAQTRYEWASTCYFPVLTGGVVTGPASRLPDERASVRRFPEGNDDRYDFDRSTRLSVPGSKEHRDGHEMPQM